MTHHTVVLNTQTNTNVGIQQEVVFATILPENPGSFKKFCELVRVVVVIRSLIRTMLCIDAYLTTSDLVRNYLHYLMGGRSSIGEEFLYYPRWNISLFHNKPIGLYLSANVLVRIQVPEKNMAYFRTRAQVLGYEYVLVSEDTVFKLFVH
ncbi:hypothetical protein Bca4012_099591 [Brassica carinata]|nr:unnamed protein product [Brassica napus]CDY07513.1 BnaC06g15510D [Brassica napus]